MKYKIGTVVEDRGSIGMISAILPKGCESFAGWYNINWRDNYEIKYADNTIYVIGIAAFHRLVDQGAIKIISPTAALPLHNKSGYLLDN